ncbi:hypothetical protein HU200_021620 [Digitaria exilis]|uniref:DUF4220 domain-containing protein n=1 Tax=Digitaria exilis TaxID=1010633 RepID=A0A835EZF8_9POAL|nr:hypothetical protein HU200_021620 [Digitaria exilis]
MMQHQQHLSVRNATRAAVKWSASPVGRLVRVEVLVTLSCALLTLLVFLGSGRRYSRSAAFRALVWSALMLSYPAVSYTIGLMQSASFQNDLMVVWACFLLGCADGIAACSIDDSDQQARLLFNQAAQTIYVFLLLLSYAGSLRFELKILLFVFWVLTVAKLGLRMHRLLSVGRDRVLTVDNGLITKYMRHEHELLFTQKRRDKKRGVSTWLMVDDIRDRYNYVVTGEENLQDELGEFKLIHPEEESDVVTLSDGLYQHSNSFRSCVSFALFKLLRRRLVGSPQYELHESVVHRGSRRGSRRRMYRVIETELGFLFDFFYSSMSSLFSSTLMHYNYNKYGGGGAMSSSNSVVATRVVKMRIPKPTIGNILILHIATTICGWKEQQQQADQQVHHGEDQETASTISAYCAYLICDAPELITDNIYEARLLLEGVKRRAPGCLGDCRSEDGMYTKLLEYSFKPPKEEDDEYMAILAQGVSTYRLLASKFPDDAERWKLLAQLWVKFLLSNVAPSNNLAAHVKRLASGGEFITHLWAFMTQGGFVKQPWVPCGDGRTQRDLEAGRRQDR